MALTAVVILVIYVIVKKCKCKLFRSSLIVNDGQRQRSRHSVEEHSSADISIRRIPEVKNTIRLEENPPLESAVPSSPSTNAIMNETLKFDRDRSLPLRKCDRIPIYIFLGPNERDPPFPKAPIECKNNLAYIHLGPEDILYPRIVPRLLLHRMSLSHANVMRHTFTWIQKNTDIYIHMKKLNDLNDIVGK